MFKRLTMSLVTLAMIGGMAMADDLLDEVGGLDLSQIDGAMSEVEDFDLANVDVDGLASDAGMDNNTEAIEACFRRIGYYQPRCWGQSYPRYSSYYSYYPHCYCYRPITYCYSHYCRPNCSYYWGCY